VGFVSFPIPDPASPTSGPVYCLDAFVTFQLF